MAKRQTAIGGWIQRSLRQSPPRSKSLIITLFGDLIAPHVSGLWLSELIALLAPFHINERLARTSSFRLMEEGWLASQRDGRRSRYALTPSGLQRVEHAYHRIYDSPPVSWDGNWVLVVLSKSGTPAVNRVELRRELGWQGFGLLTPGVFLHPSADLHDLREVLQRLRLSDSVAVLRARDLEEVSSSSVAALIHQCWDLDAVGAHYAGFVKQFEPVLPMIRQGTDAETAYLIQTLLVHSFRRVVLHDPRIPAVLLPENWPGHRAYELCSEIYLQTCGPAQAHLATEIEDAAMVRPVPDLQRRFQRAS